jgi:hypothetical protein
MVRPGSLAADTIEPRRLKERLALSSVFAADLFCASVLALFGYLFGAVEGR